MSGSSDSAKTAEAEPKSSTEKPSMPVAFLCSSILWAARISLLFRRIFPIQLWWLDISNRKDETSLNFIHLGLGAEYFSNFLSYPSL